MSSPKLSHAAGVSIPTAVVRCNAASFALAIRNFFSVFERIRKRLCLGYLESYGDSTDLNSVEQLIADPPDGAELDEILSLVQISPHLSAAQHERQLPLLRRQRMIFPSKAMPHGNCNDVYHHI